MWICVVNTIYHFCFKFKKKNGNSIQVCYVNLLILSIYLSTYLPTYLPTDRPTPTDLPTNIPTYPTIYPYLTLPYPTLSIYLSTYLSVSVRGYIRRSYAIVINVLTWKLLVWGVNLFHWILWSRLCQDANSLLCELLISIKLQGHSNGQPSKTLCRCHNNYHSLRIRIVYWWNAETTITHQPSP